MEKVFDLSGVLVALAHNIPVWLLLSFIMTRFWKKQDRDIAEKEKEQLHRETEQTKRIDRVETERKELLQKLEDLEQRNREQLEHLESRNRERHHEIANDIQSMKLSLGALQVIEIRESLEVLKEHRAEMRSEITGIWRHIELLEKRAGLAIGNGRSGRDERSGPA